MMEKNDFLINKIYTNGLKKIYIKNNKNRIANQYPRVNDLLIDGTLRYRRQTVPAKYLHNIELENNNVMVKFVKKRNSY